MDIQFICPSYKRAGITKSEKCIDGLIFAVHRFEEQLYKETYPDNEIITLSDDSCGNMAKVRNEMLEKTSSDKIVMVDDDCSYFGYYEKGEQNRLSKDQIYELAVLGFTLSSDLGTPLWGLNLLADYQAYREYSPFSMLSPILGPFSGIDKARLNGIRYDERLGLNEDYDFFMQVIRKFKKALRLNKYFYMADHLLLDNGCASYRTLNKEYAQAIIMLKKWGNKPITYDFKKSTNPRVRVPLKGI